MQSKTKGGRCHRDKELRQSTEFVPAERVTVPSAKPGSRGSSKPAWLADLPRQRKRQAHISKSIAAQMQWADALKWVAKMSYYWRRASWLRRERWCGIIGVACRAGRRESTAVGGPAWSMQGGVPVPIASTEAPEAESRLAAGRAPGEFNPRMSQYLRRSRFFIKAGRE